MKCVCNGQMHGTEIVVRDIKDDLASRQYDNIS